MAHCFQSAEQATEMWVRRLANRTDLAFTDPAYQAMWQTHNQQAAIRESMPQLA